MKKLLLSLFCLALPFLILDLLFIHAEFDFGDNDIKKFRSVPKDIQIGNSGPSWGGAFDYSDYPEYTAFNFSLTMQAWNWDEAILNQYIGNFAPGGVYFIVAPVNEADGLQPDFQLAKIKNRYFQFMKFKYIPETDFFEYLQGKYFPILDSLHPFKKIYSSLLKKEAAVDPAIHIREEDFSSEADKKKLIHMFESAFTSSGEDGVSRNLQTLMRMIRLCNEHDVYPVLVTNPFPDITNDYLKSEAKYFETFARFKTLLLEEVKKENLNCQWLDYSASPEFTGHIEYYADLAHMNKVAAKIFTKRVLDDTRKLNILK